jgi:hypothetical protein
VGQGPNRSHWPIIINKLQCLEIDHFILLNIHLRVPVVRLLSTIVQLEMSLRVMLIVENKDLKSLTLKGPKLKEFISVFDL